MFFVGPLADGLEPEVLGPFSYSLKNNILYSKINDTLVNTAQITFENNNTFFLKSDNDPEPIYFKRKK